MADSTIHQESLDRASTDPCNLKTTLNRNIQYLLDYPLLNSSEEKQGPGRPKKTKCSLESIQNLLGVVISSIAGMGENIKSIDATCKKIDQRLFNLEHRVEMVEENVLDNRLRSNNLEKRIELLEQKPSETSPLSSNNVLVHESYKENPVIEELQSEIEKIKQDQLNNSILLCGHSVSERLQLEDVNSACFSLLKEIPNLDIHRLNIINCKKIVHDDKPEKIKVQFANSTFKKELFPKFFKMKKKHFFINEILVPRKAKLFFELRMLQKELRKEKKDIIKSAYTRNGDIFYILTNAKIPKKLCSSSDLEQLSFACRAILKNKPEEESLTIQNQ